MSGVLVADVTRVGDVRRRWIVIGPGAREEWEVREACDDLLPRRADGTGTVLVRITADTSRFDEAMRSITWPRSYPGPVTRRRGSPTR